MERGSKVVPTGTPSQDGHLFKLYKQVVENLTEGIWIGSLGKTPCTLYWNRGAEKISGFKRKHLTGRNLIAAVPALKEVLAATAAAADGKMKKRISFERYRYCRRGHPKHPRHLNIQAYVLSGTKMILIVFEDITEKAGLERDIMQHNRELAALNEIGHTVNQTLELNSVLNTALHKVLEVMDCESGGIYIRQSRDSDDLLLRVTKGLSPSFLSRFKRIRLGAGLMGRGLARNRAVILKSVTRRTKLTDHRAPGGIKLAVSVPITVKDRLIGAFNVASYTHDTFEPWKVALLFTIGNNIGVVIENAILMDALKKHEQDLQILSSQIIKAQEEERKRISRELHDEASQALLAVKINVEMIKKKLPPGSAEVTTRLAETSALLMQTLEDLRRLAHDLRPSMLDDLGLIPTLRWYTESYARRLGMSISLRAVALKHRPHIEIETALYRIVQEALTNIAKYAQAQKVSISLVKKRSSIIATVEDNGKGFSHPPAHAEPCFRGSGILGMKERVSNLGGRFHIESREGRGTRIMVEIPLNRRR